MKDVLMLTGIFSIIIAITWLFGVIAKELKYTIQKKKDKKEDVLYYKKEISRICLELDVMRDLSDMINLEIYQDYLNELHKKENIKRGLEERLYKRMDD